MREAAIFLMLFCGFGASHVQALILSNPPPAHVTGLTIQPAKIDFTNPDQNVQLLVTFQFSDGTVKDATHVAKYLADSEGGTNIARITQGRISPRGNGETIVNISVEDETEHKTITGSVKVSVRDFQVDRRLNFANDIVPILTKAGCNAGGCHGKAEGQNGFRLSLLGFEPDFDYDALVKQSRGRRLFPASPDQSLLLQKATSALVHGGGQRLDPHSDAYAVLRRWIVQGMPRGSSNDPTVVSIEVQPRERLLSGGGHQQLRVVAHYSDASTQDVTSQAEYKCQQPEILAADSAGSISALNRTGEGSVMVRYMGLVDVARVAVPFSLNVPASAYDHFEPKNFVDRLVAEKWHKLGIAPSPLCSDEEFIRRASLGAIGTLPTSMEVRQFLADKSRDKRDQLIDRLLERSEYADFWANYWGDLLRNKRNGDEQKRGTYAFAAWLRDCFARNLPYDQFVGQILAAQGTVSDNPAIVWYRTVRNQVAQVNDTCQVFLGTRISCANCHHHPYEKWSQDDYWGFAAFYSRLGNKAGDTPADQAVFVRKEGETHQPRSGKKMNPKALGGPEFTYVRGDDPRQKLVEWLTTQENPFFARAMANRTWAHFMGVGLVEAVDDMRVTNPPSNPDLLDALAQDFASHKFDIKHLMRTIMQSQAYGLSSSPTPYNATDRQNYSRYTTRRLAAETLLDAVSAVTGVQEKFAGFPAGTRAIELPDEKVSSYFLDVFGRSQRESPCECERSYAPNLSQVLHLMNSPEIQGKITNEKGCLSTLLKEGKPDDQVVEELYWRAFARAPRADELKDATVYLAGEKDRKIALEDFEWTLLNSKEFLFDH